MGFVTLVSMYTENHATSGLNIQEMRSRESDTALAVFYGNPKITMRWGSPVNLADDYHVYGLEWNNKDSFDRLTAFKGAVPPREWVVFPLPSISAWAFLPRTKAGMEFQIPQPHGQVCLNSSMCAHMSGPAFRRTCRRS